MLQYLHCQVLYYFIHFNHNPMKYINMNENEIAVCQILA